MGYQLIFFIIITIIIIVVCNCTRKIIKVTHPTITGSQPLFTVFYGWSHPHTTLQSTSIDSTFKMLR